MEKEYQIVISGVGGQGVLFVTRILAEAAIRKNLPVFTSETHGMAQRGGTVISHLKVGDFSSPLIRPGEADGLIALKSESLEQHGGYLKPDGWAAINGGAEEAEPSNQAQVRIDADRLAQDMGNPKSLNLIMLGFSLSGHCASRIGRQPLYCTHDDVTAILRDRLEGKDALLKSAVEALEAGASFGG